MSGLWHTTWDSLYHCSFSGWEKAREGEAGSFCGTFVCRQHFKFIFSEHSPTHCGLSHCLVTSRVMVCHQTGDKSLTEAVIIKHPSPGICANIFFSLPEGFRHRLSLKYWYLNGEQDSKGLFVHNGDSLNSISLPYEDCRHILLSIRYYSSWQILKRHYNPSYHQILHLVYKYIAHYIGPAPKMVESPADVQNSTVFLYFYCPHLQLIVHVFGLQS